MNRLLWLDGRLARWEEATIHIATHTLHYGSGAFEGIRCYSTECGPAVFRLSAHITRLLSSFSVFGVKAPWHEQELQQAVIQTIKSNGFNSCYVRPIIFFGNQSLVLSPQNLSVHCAIIALPWDKYLGNEPVTVGISSFRRISSHAMPLHNKTNGLYANSILALHDVRARGFHEALLLDNNGFIAEASVANAFFVIDGILRTPPPSEILPGITRDTVLHLAKELGVAVSQQPLSLEDVQFATEAFFTGTASEITPIAKLEQKEFAAPGPITKLIQKNYLDCTHGKLPSCKCWLTFI